jgi:DNA recombination protein RmuC
MSFELQNTVFLAGFAAWLIAMGVWVYASFREKKREMNELRAFCTTLQSENMELRVQKAKLEAELVAQKEGNATLKADLEEQSHKLELKLNAIMEQHLEKKLQKLDETSTKSLETLLKPFKENLETFKKSVETSQEHSTKKFAELSKEIELVARAGLNISKEAENLTKALKGKKQSQGSWGEMILESVLEYSGLLKGVHYETQESYKDEEGRTKRPDVVIKLPQDRTIIIDSKVSLNSYDEYVRSESDEEKRYAAKMLTSAFREHVDTLDSKDYAHYKQGTLQYVFMFVPIEGAFSVAIGEDPKLYEYALRKHIAIVNPSTLTVSLRTIYLYWQSEQSSTLASKLFEEAGKMYDKMVGFAENFRRVGAQIQTLNNSYDIAHKQLAEGPGNIMSRVENLKRLGAKATKNLKDAKIDYQDFSPEVETVELLEDKQEEQQA